MAKQLLLIDGNSIVFRAFFAMHNQIDKFTNKDGLHTAAIYGFKLMLDHVLENFHPDAALVAFDAGKVTFRTKMYADYKGGRNKTPEELTEQFPYVRELVRDSGLHTYELKDYEADDIIGTLAKEGDEAGYETLIVTGDRDLTQLASNHTTVAVTHKGVTDTEHYTPEHVKEKLGITPTQIIDMKALMGDSSDNYPGVTKIGEKTAIKLVKQFGSVEGIYENIDQLKKSKMKEHLVEEEAIARQCKTLATILRDAPIDIKLADLNYNGPQTEKLIDFYQKMDFRSFLKKLDVLSDEQEVEIAPIKYTELTANNLELVSQLGDRGSFYLEMPDANYHTSPFAGFVIGNGKQWLVSRDSELLKTKQVREWLADSAIKKDVFNAKAQIVGLNRLGIELKGIDFDLLLASYLLNTNDNSNDLGKLAQEHEYADVQTDEEVYGKGVKRAIPNDEIFFKHLANKARAIEKLRSSLFKQLDENEQLPLYTDIELPLAHVLAKMEITGVHVNAQTLKDMGSKLTERLAEIKEQIYQEAGEEFNVNSTKQLGQILFEKLKLPVIKKTKTGYSTAVDVLEKLAPQAPIVENILQYRQISKLQSTYIKGLLKVIHSSDQKIHTRYLQTLTQTGRLSSVDPNLQNIPVRLPEGRQIRRAFVPSYDGWQIFSSDYSQVELRVLAHITGDHNLQEDFKNGEDIHASTARRIFHLKPEERIDRDMRRRAKAVNFGIVYGISDYGLAQRIHVSRSQAHEFIQSYFKEFPKVKDYIHDTIEFARKNGYVETITHRRRYLPDINAKNFSRRSFAERTAMNTPIQGSAADIIKIAMIRMQDELEKHHLKAKMLLQIHDELVFEAPKEEISVLSRLVPDVMDSAVKLAVPLKVDSKYGDTWYDLKK
ncbi:DNA polymerase I [Limosilactobacillus fastidiosus]|uniref:DNA polymerase I n=1 Tax=Limosilactobacillus fastidiosus TaxID=2759855 RepID=A0A7W3YD46_9LACO|nr:DNA polymerase I [Limosilactobacillus fastidiosus]MBB1063680.1 DNA polymerase I [Limosilactobacillus fastidiosus]MBB1086791.1 DNA polymerase I [Limosilactobacillus fastidiosus]MCD7084255.1 DNA polymerase I [Limosilactobacillus fastidiosus]MCD7085482.1 DNA polymerase I [Limosilactobacillus fastidiosus]MCD7114713.1 DNA polymerase I [Limosilactobacillus fastidiosus]